MIPTGQVIVSEVDLRTLHDRIYRLEAAVEDVDADLATSTTAVAYRAAFDHLYEAAQGVAGTVIEPVRQ
jgi:hypothetical protein